MPPPEEGSLVEIVNDAFWLGWAADAVRDAMSRRIAAAERLTAATGWFWTIYSAVAITGVVLSDRQVEADEWVLLFLPTVTLSFAYLVALWAALPIDMNHDPRVPVEIESSYTTAINKRRCRLRLAVGAVLVAAVTVALAGYQATQLAPPARDYDMSAELAQVTNGENVLVTATVDPDVLVRVAIQASGADSISDETLVTADSDGSISTELAANDSPDHWVVTAEWDSSDVEHVLRLELPPS